MLHTLMDACEVLEGAGISKRSLSLQALCMRLFEDAGTGADVGFNASVTIEELGSPDKIIQGFAPELYGSPLSVRLSSCPGASDFSACCADKRQARSVACLMRRSVLCEAYNVKMAKDKCMSVLAP